MSLYTIVFIEKEKIFFLEFLYNVYDKTTIQQNEKQDEKFNKTKRNVRFFSVIGHLIVLKDEKY